MFFIQDFIRATQPATTQRNTKQAAVVTRPSFSEARAFSRPMPKLLQPAPFLGFKHNSTAGNSNMQSAKSFENTAHLLLQAARTAIKM